MSNFYNLKVENGLNQIVTNAASCLQLLYLCPLCGTYSDNLKSTPFYVFHFNMEIFRIFSSLLTHLAGFPHIYD